MQTLFSPGLLAFHGNRAEDLAEVVIQWLRRHPLEPLHEDVILVQSNGMAEWFKTEMARLGGVCAACRVELPSRFLWRTFRQILGAEAVPAASPLDKLPMTWRLMSLLPGLLARPEFAPVSGFLTPGEPERLYQLAGRLADLFDQYQNYRADWLDAWAQGEDQLMLANGSSLVVPDEQRWQPQLWRAVLDTLSTQQQHSIRPQLHARVLRHLHCGEPVPPEVAPRVIVFGMSQIPWNTLQTLAALARHSQVILAVPNPCRFYWGDIMDGRELLRAAHKRQRPRGGMDLSTLPLQDMHAHAHPLLAAWGRQGRDFVRQLDVFDDVERSQRQFQLPDLDFPRIDLFDGDEIDDDTPLLRQVQIHIRDLVALTDPQHAPRRVAVSDRSIVFHSAHTMVRELEVLHDELLQMLAAQGALSPRDVIVMMPDVEPAAPAIEAVFGRYERTDPRYIPFGIADTSVKTGNPLIKAVLWMLSLPQQRCRLSELVELLEVAAVASRFGVAQASLPQLARWMAGSGIRWGLNSEHRAGLDLGACGEQNSAWFGLRRMLLGYASGRSDVDAASPAAALGGIDPYAEVAGLDAELAGALAHLLQSLQTWVQRAATPATPVIWVSRLRQLLADMVKADSEIDRQSVRALEEGLLAWQQDCDHAGFEDAIPVTVASAAWMQAVEPPNLRQRFRAGGVTFCTLMPMRAIPFQVVCLLGMNGGDYPRRTSHSDFDLMGLAGTSRPGDRSRRNDDRQLMLEAVLSARRTLYVSWCGRSVRDNSEQPPSVLVSQLRDYLAAGWAIEVLSQRTTQHPLQPFSRAYFQVDSPFQTYAHEWFEAYRGESSADSVCTPCVVAVPNAAVVPPDPATAPPAAAAELPAAQAVTLAQLTQLLKNPVKTFFRRRLSVSFDDIALDNADDERFELNGLAYYQLMEHLLKEQTALDSPPVSDSASLVRSVERLRMTGVLPLAGIGDLAQQTLLEEATTLLDAWQLEMNGFPVAADRQWIRVADEGVVLEDWLDHLRQSALPDDLGQASAGAQQITSITLEPGKLLDRTKPQPRPEKLLGAWLRSLAASACGLCLHGVLIGRDGVIHLSPVAPEQALQTLKMLLRLWRQGMDGPLPLPPRTALAWLKKPESAAAAYEGSHTASGEVDEPCLARMYPDFAALRADGEFDTLARQVFGALLDWTATCVTARFHASMPLEEDQTP